jgi:hypothetical protein
MLRESCVLQKIKKLEKGSRNLRKPENENISLYATLLEPEFRCFTLNSSTYL